MPLIVNTNTLSLNAQRHLSTNTSALQKSMEKLASGYRINRAGDDAAGLQLSESLRAQVRGSQKALANIQDGIGVLNIMDGAYQQITENLQRIRELAVQGMNDTYSTEQVAAMQAEVDQLTAEITRISDAVEFNGVKLLDGSSTTFIIQLGANDSSTEDQLDLEGATNDPFDNADWATLGSAQAATIGTSTAIGAADIALTATNARRGAIGAFVNRLEGAANNLSVAIENLSASESRIRNVDVAAESANLTRNQILQQAAAAMLAQANQTPTLALQLLQG